MEDHCRVSSAYRIVQQMQAHKMSENREMSVRSEMGHLELATSKMVALLETLHDYVRDVLSGKVEGDIQVGRTLMEALSKVPNIPPPQFDTLLNNSMQVHWGRG